jgi:hypothetical protein
MTFPSAGSQVTMSLPLDVSPEEPFCPDCPFWPDCPLFDPDDEAGAWTDVASP